MMVYRTTLTSFGLSYKPPFRTRVAGTPRRGPRLKGPGQPPNNREATVHGDMGASRVARNANPTSCFVGGSCTFWLRFDRVVA